MLAQAVALCSAFPDLLAVETIHRRIAPGSDAFYVTAEDGELYILKVFPLNRASLFARREVFAHAIGTQLGFSMAHWKALQVDSQTLAGYSASEDGKKDADKGLLVEGVYYSSMVQEGPGSPFEFLPRKLAHSNMEVARQLGCILMYDVWIANAGRRERVVMVEDGLPAHVYFFAHRQILSPENPGVASMRAATAYAKACQITGDKRAVDSIMHAIASLRSVDIYAAFRRVPAFWLSVTGCDEEGAVRLLELRSEWFRALVRRGFSASPAQPLFPSGLMCDTVHTKSEGIRAHME